VEAAQPRAGLFAVRSRASIAARARGLSPMAVTSAAARRFLALAPARGPRAFWSASCPPDPDAPSASSTSTDNNSRRKKKEPSGSAHHRLAAVMDAVNERKLPPELSGRGNAVRSVSQPQVPPPYRSQEKKP
jgi:hypothetical protein